MAHGLLPNVPAPFLHRSHRTRCECACVALLVPTAAIHTDGQMGGAETMHHVRCQWRLGLVPLVLGWCPTAAGPAPLPHPLASHSHLPSTMRSLATTCDYRSWPFDPCMSGWWREELLRAVLDWPMKA